MARSLGGVLQPVQFMKQFLLRPPEVVAKPIIGVDYGPWTTGVAAFFPVSRQYEEVCVIKRDRNCVTGSHSAHMFCVVIKTDEVPALRPQYRRKCRRRPS